MELQQIKRECSDCDVCCNILEVRELNKKSFCNCVHRADHGGCGVYETRPSICRDWSCAYILDLIPGGEEIKPNNLGLMFYPVDAKNNDLGMSMLMGQEVWPDALYSSDAQAVISYLSKRIFTMIRHYKSEEFTYVGPPNKLEEFNRRHSEYMKNHGLGEV